MKKSRTFTGLRSFLSVLMVLLIGLTVFGVKAVYAEGETELQELKEDNSQLLEFKVSEENPYVSEDDPENNIYQIKESAVEYEQRDALGAEYIMEVGKVYRVTYPNALTLVDGTKLTVRVDVEALQNSTYVGPNPSYSKVLIYRGSAEPQFNYMVRVYWREAQDAKIKWTISLYKDPECTQPNDRMVLTGLEDPDESDYVFDTTGRSVFYKEPEDIAVTGDSILNPYHGYQFTTGTDGGFRRINATLGVSPSGYTRALFLVSLPDKFEFVTRTYRNGTLIVPFFYGLCYKVVYDANSPTGAYTGTVEAQNNQFGADKQIAMNGFAVDGYVFDGWNTVAKPTEEDPGIAFAEEDPYNVPVVDDAENTFKQAVPAGGEVKIYAQWLPAYTLHFDANYKPDAIGTDGSMEDITPIQYGEEEILTKNAFSTKNYRFVGWNTEPDGSGTSFVDEAAFKSSSFGLTDDPKEGEPGVVVNLYAQWEPEYNVEYKINLPSDGTEAPESVQVPTQTELAFGETNTLNPNTFASIEYQWVGWNTAADGSGKSFANLEQFTDTSFDREVKPGDTVTLYAQWELWKHKIHYDANGGTGTMDTQVFTYKDKEMVSKRNEFTRDKYKFLGFLYTAPDGTSTLYQSINDFAAILKGLGKGSEITLVAQWERIIVPSKPTYNPPVTGVE